MDGIPSGEDKVSKVANVALDFLQQELPLSSQFTFLDIGCGNGCDIDFLSSKWDNLILRGIDVSSEAIESSIERVSDKDNVSFECMDWKNLDDRQYDIVYMSGVYHFFPLAERQAFISKLKTNLKPEGYFFLSTLSSNDTQYFGEGEPVQGDLNSFQSEYFLHFCSEVELRRDFEFLEILELFEYFHKNYAQDTEYHTMWMLIAQKT